MKSFPFSATCRLGLALALPLLAGCSSLFEAKPDSTRFFLLSAPSIGAATPAATDTSRNATVGLCLIELPAYLRTPAVVLRPGGTEVRHALDACWAEPLEQGIARVLRETLQAQPGVRSVVAYPAPQAVRPAYEISVRVLACEGVTGSSGRQMRFAATWEIRATAAEVGAAPVAAGTFESAPADWAEGDYAALTAKLGESIAALGRELAAALPR
jgi:uncharacterized lipoprotein YmbA